MLNILVPVDGSALAERALPYAIQIARATGGLLTLVRATWIYPFEFAESRADLPPGAERVVEELADAAARVRHAGATVETHVGFGDAPYVIREAARGRGADLIVMSTHGRGGLGRWVYGSVAETVLGTTDVPVLLVPAAGEHPWPTDRPLRVLVPLDGSDLAEETLPAVGALASALEAELVLLRAVPPTAPRPTGVQVIGTPAGYALTYQDDTDLAIAHARHYLEDVVDLLRAVAPVRDVRVELGGPAAAIADVVRDQEIDLVAMATHGRTGLASLTMGSVAATTLRRAAVPVMLLRPSAMRPSAEAPVAADATAPHLVPLSGPDLALIERALERLLSGEEPGDAPRALLRRLAHHRRAQPAGPGAAPLF
jgi:nucleotide-binding universal stress UspA family protein